MNYLPDLIESTRPNRTSSSPRFGMFIALLWITGAILISRSFYLQVVHGAEFRQRAEHNRVSSRLLPAHRGILYDRNNTQLVENVSSTDLVLDPVLLPGIHDETYLIERIPQLVPTISAEDMRSSLQRARKTQRSVLLAKALDHDTVLAIEEAGVSIQGAKLQSSLVRNYLYKQATAHVLGYTSAITAAEMEHNESLLPTDTTGKRGIEQIYDDKLRGKHGVEYTEVDAAGKSQVDLGTKEPVAGDDLHLTLDIELQEFIYSIFSERASKRESGDSHYVAGAVIVTNPKNGAIQALVSYPSFDPNYFSQPGLSKDAPALFSDPQQPLFNRSVEGTYPSGSVIKPFLAAAGLAEGIITEQTTVLSTGGVSIGPWHFADWKAGGHGVTDVKKALADSVNTFFYLLTGGDETRAGLGVAKATEYLRQFGWAQQTGIDLPSEAKGLLPSPEWKQETFGEAWYIGDTYHFGIGQGNVLATPLQIASGTSAIANGTYWNEPHVVDMTTPRHDITIDPRHIKVVQEGMRQTVTNGSGKSLQELSIPLAGKTGTAQIGGTEDTHAWFTSFGPYEDPEFVVTVLLERGGAGDVDAVPFAKEIWQWIGEKRQTKP